MTATKPHAAPPLQSIKVATRSGGSLDLLDPQPHQIYLPDVLIPLSHANRYANQTRQPLTVLAHSLALSRLVPAGLEMAALLHDAGEAYTGDIIAPVKRLLPAASRNLLEHVERNILRAIEAKLGIPFTDQLDDVEKYDRALCDLEMLHHYGRHPATQISLIEPQVALREIEHVMRMTPSQVQHECLMDLCGVSQHITTAEIRFSVE